MHRYAASVVVLLLVMSPRSVVSQQIAKPEMTVPSFNTLEPQVFPDGRKVRRIAAATVTMIKVEWPMGTSTTPHNHAHELLLTVLQGRLRAIGGDRELVMEPGDVVVIPAWVAHSYVAMEDTLTLEAVGPENPR